MSALSRGFIISSDCTTSKIECGIKNHPCIFHYPPSYLTFDTFPTGRFDVLHLCRERIYQNLERITIQEAIAARPGIFEDVVTCRSTESLAIVAERLARYQVRQSHLQKHRTSGVWPLWLNVLRDTRWDMVWFVTCRSTKSLATVAERLARYQVGQSHLLKRRISDHCG